MDKKSLESIRCAAGAIPCAPMEVMAGAMLTARHCYDALSLSNGHPLWAKEIAEKATRSSGRPISPENVRQILRAMAAGGIPIQSATSKGYWLN